jgi:hypothetical protein
MTECSDCGMPLAAYSIHYHRYLCHKCDSARNGKGY